MQTSNKMAVAPVGKLIWQMSIELFARQKTPGWDVWGNEVDCTITLPERKEEI